MLSFSELNRVWAVAVRNHAVTPMADGNGKSYLPIGAKTLTYLDALWTRQPDLPDIGALIEAGKTVRFWGDPHYRHDNIRRLCDRDEFSSVEEMDETIDRHVREAMDMSDVVVCVGDLAMKDAITYQTRMRKEFGDRHLILLGNHDPKGATPAEWARAGALASLAFSLPTKLLEGWGREDFGDLAEFVDWSRLPARINFGCCHWPVPPDRLPGPAWVSVHGHTHNRHTGSLRLNCSVEAIGYRPALLRQLVTPELFEDLNRRQ